MTYQGVRDCPVEHGSAVRSGLTVQHERREWCDPSEADTGSTHATNVMIQERYGQEIAIREAADPVAVVCRLGNLKSAAPLPAEMTADLDRRAGCEDRPRWMIWEEFRCSLTAGADLDGGTDREVQVR